VAGTHSWIEPTALHVRALKNAGYTGHPRVREAVRMLLDRLLPGGGCNYGNTWVLGQLLRPHVQPTGIALVALAGETDSRGRIAASLDYLDRQPGDRLGAASLSWAVLALAAHQRPVDGHGEWIDAAAQRNRHVPHRRALLILAAQQCRTPEQPLLLGVHLKQIDQSTETREGSASSFPDGGHRKEPT
jgi:hypothetical protein